VSERLRRAARRLSTAVRTRLARKPKQLFLVKPSLDGLPPVCLPAGYTLRHFREGDQASWNTLLDLAFDVRHGGYDFDRDMKPDPAFRAERVMIVEHAGTVAATASAWYRPALGAHCGYIEWVATHPQHRGHRLGYWANLAALHRMKAEGRTAVALHTDDFRLAALRLYLGMGFQPVIDDPSHRERWRKVLDTLQWPERFEATLAGPLERLVRRLPWVHRSAARPG
jgi:mycothiol synthase